LDTVLLLAVPSIITSRYKKELWSARDTSKVAIEELTTLACTYSNRCVVLSRDRKGLRETDRYAQPSTAKPNHQARSRPRSRIAHSPATQTSPRASIIITLAHNSLAFLRAARPTADPAIKAIRVRIEKRRMVPPGGCSILPTEAVLERGVFWNVRSLLPPIRSGIVPRAAVRANNGPDVTQN
jgi:hypothetical protein